MHSITQKLIIAKAKSEEIMKKKLKDFSETLTLLLKCLAFVFFMYCIVLVIV